MPSHHSPFFSHPFLVIPVSHGVYYVCIKYVIKLYTTDRNVSTSKYWFHYQPYISRVGGSVVVHSYLPAQLSEADVELMSSARCLLIAAVVICKGNTGMIRKLHFNNVHRLLVLLLHDMCDCKVKSDWLTEAALTENIQIIVEKLNILVKKTYSYWIIVSFLRS